MNHTTVTFPGRLSAWRIGVALLCGVGLATRPHAAPAPQVAAAEGLWLDQSGKAAIRIAPCGSQLCGRIAWLRAPLDEAGKPKTDIHNNDAALRARPLCGLPLLAGFDADGANAWSGGTIYDPESGSTYQSTMRLEPDGTLRVRGYVGISLLGRSQTWTRPAADLPACR